MRHRWALVGLLLLLAGCSTEAPPEDVAPSASPTRDDQPTAAASPTPSTTDAPALPPLADAPGGDASLWLDTIGIPVVAAVRTSTPLTGLAELGPEQRTATCRQVAADLDGIAAPQVLTGLAITADAETATLLVGDLQAKGDLLAACVAGGDELDARIAEVQRTHAVAVAWLARLRGEA